MLSPKISSKPRSQTTDGRSGIEFKTSNDKMGSIKEAGFVAQSVFHKQGGEYTSISAEKRNTAAVCKIDLGDGRTASGFLAYVHGCIGILTNNDVLPRKTSCRKANAVFLYEGDGKDITIKFNPDKYFWTDSKNATFVGCEHGNLRTANIVALSLDENKKVNVGTSVSIYHHPKGKSKKELQTKVYIERKDSIKYHGETDSGSCGAPVFCGDMLVALHRGKTDFDDDEEDIDEDEINKAVYISQIVDAIPKKIGKREEMRQWLASLGMENYLDRFSEEEYDDVGLIKALNTQQFEKMITTLGCSSRSVLELRKDRSTRLNGMDHTVTKRVLTNAPMKKYWRPISGKHIDLTNQYTNSNGSTSIKNSSALIKQQLDAGQSFPNTFYIKSSSQDKYFKFEIKTI